ncbi:CDK-activating kinase assembly factor [Decorospora gaudefroyi]|uniref:CDK-activating kinase assembly factor n=1 Tax=Decorospora gaudefroyi TaxID=184978 RepID=A0A6A5K2Z6_9PLEO|nr:CDK-activating kinase assembly factor [Decorospora gaudefroyi]
MSKQAGRAGGASKRQAEDGDICPVCKSSRYLNSTMEFKINPACYHRMCDTCVERIFKKGNNMCPVAGCAKTLAYKGFRRATFEDLQVEREVDIRKRVMKVMNKKEDDFETLRDYNDYLEQVEEITWNLILNIDKDATERKLDRFEAVQKAEGNAGVSKREPTKSTARVALNKGIVPEALNNDDADTDFSFRGLKKRVAPPKEAPFDPWGGYNIAQQYYVLQDNYDVDWYARMKSDPAHLVGGHSMQEYCSRALREAFGGFGVFIEDEIAARDDPSMDAGVGTEHAAAAAVSGDNVNMDDVF